MAEMITQNGIQYILANPSPNPDSPDFQQIVVQVTELKQMGSTAKFSFDANDGRMKNKAMFTSDLQSEVMSNKIQNLGLIRILDYTLNNNPANNKMFLIVTKCESVSAPLGGEYKVGPNGEGELANAMTMNVENKVKSQRSGIVMKPKQETQSAMQIALNMAPVARMANTRRVLPLVSLNPYQGNWTIKVRVTSKGPMRRYNNARGDGCVFNVELTDEDGTEIQATMFNKAAELFFDKFVMGKVYYISKGTLKVANKQYKTVSNEYEMTLNENSVVDEAEEETFNIPETKFNFVPIDQLGPYVNRRELVDVIGVVQSVSNTMSIKRKSNNEEMSKRDITIADSTKKTVTVSLWNDLATDIGQTLCDMSDKSPVVAIKSVKVGEYQGISLSALSKSVIVVNPETPEAKNLKSWFDSEGKDTAMAAVGEGLSTFAQGGTFSLYKDRVLLPHITSTPSLGDGDKKGAYFSIKAYVTHIKPDQTMWYHACKKCNRKVADGIGSTVWCEGCSENKDGYNLRYIMTVKVTDVSGEGYVTVFNDQAEKVVGCSADELNDLKSSLDADDTYAAKLKGAQFNPYVCRVGVTTNEYNGEKRQRITIRSIAPVDYEAESKYLLEEISKL